MSTSRGKMRESKKRSPEEEDASKLQFNEEFESGECSCISLSEAGILLEQAKLQNPENHGASVDKMIEYCKTFRTFKDRESVTEIRRTLNKYELHEFEISQIINLVPEKIEEVKSHIPSLRSASNEKIEDIINDVNELKKYQG